MCEGRIDLVYANHFQMTMATITTSMVAAKTVSERHVFAILRL